MPEAETDLRTAWTKGRKLVLYGAGGAGREVARGLLERGITPVAFLDAKAAPGDMRDGIPSFTIADWVACGYGADTDVLVTIHSHAIKVSPILDQLRAAGFTSVLSMVDYANLFPDDISFRYWLVPSAYYAEKGEAIAAARHLLADDTSRVWFDAIMRLRLKGDYHGLPEPSFIEQYMPGDLPRWAEPVRLLDCGAYDGDTLRSLLRAKYEIAALVAFEPDLANYAKLTAYYGTLNAMFIPCGLSASARIMHFSSGLGAASRVGDTGDTGIQCMSIDEGVPGFTPNLIKMDIEGAELDALHGAERIIRRDRPGLAIAVYHEPSHVWDIPLWVHGLDLGYKMYLRGHGHSGYDTVLYCRTY